MIISIGFVPSGSEHLLNGVTLEAIVNKGGLRSAFFACWTLIIFKHFYR